MVGWIGYIPRASLGRELDRNSLKSFGRTENNGMCSDRSFEAPEGIPVDVRKDLNVKKRVALNCWNEIWWV